MSAAVFDYQDAHKFLRERWAHRKLRNPSLSVRGWAYQLGLKNNAPLSLILQGRRPIPKTYIPGFIKTLQLEGTEAEYFEVLVALTNAKSDPERALHLKKLKKFEPLKQHSYLRSEQMSLLEDPLHGVIYEMVELKGFQPHPSWISQHIDPAAPLERIQAAVNRLFMFGLLRDESGRWVRNEAIVTTLPNDLPSRSIQEHHRRCLIRAERALSLQTTDKREFSSHALAIRKEDIPRAKAKIRDFARQFMTEFGTPRDADDVYQLCIQLFSQTRDPQAEHTQEP